MTFKQSLALGTIILALIFACGLSSVAFNLLYTHLTHTEEAPKAGNFDGGLVSMTRSATVSVGTGSTGIASTSTARRFLQIQNTSGTTAVYCAYSGTTPAVDRQGFFIAASSTLAFPFGDGPMYNGPINCIASSTVLLLINEG